MRDSNRTSLVTTSHAPLTMTSSPRGASACCLSTAADVGKHLTPSTPSAPRPRPVPAPASLLSTSHPASQSLYRLLQRIDQQCDIKVKSSPQMLASMTVSCSRDASAPTYNQCCYILSLIIKSLIHLCIWCLRVAPRNTVWRQWPKRVWNKDLLLVVLLILWRTSIVDVIFPRRTPQRTTYRNNCHILNYYNSIITLLVGTDGNICLTRSWGLHFRHILDVGYRFAPRLPTPRVTHRQDTLRKNKKTIQQTSGSFFQSCRDRVAIPPVHTRKNVT